MRTVCLVVAALLVLAAAVTGLGCGTSSGGGGRLEGTRWALRSYESAGGAREVPEDATVNALFRDGRVSGSSGVNSYSGSYELSGDELTIGQLTSTMMAGPQELMDLEQSYLRALERTASFSAGGDELVLYGEDDGVLLIYEKSKAPSLTGGTWNVVNYYNGRDAVSSVLGGTSLTATFGTNGELTGSGGVNRYRATYSTSGRDITIGAPVITTSNPASDPAVAKQEADYFAALAAASEYDISGDTLKLLRSDGAVAAAFQLAK
jgi:heat shock protein HslJ